MQIKREINEILIRAIGDEYLLFVFGSFAKGDNDRESDIDLALYRDKKITSGEIAAIKEVLNKSVHTLREIDLVNLTDSVSKELLENILKEGIVWHGMKNSSELMKDLKKRLTNTERL
ncbi:MAG: nucleotidyltransferase domain-containing protein [Nanoarchaeota archaeon]|nr:nucleotidyltransferase domain-containing protein [bacterium]MBU3957793.1 nucleotidyltransferase domain-containing protein [Nanoarchaeota archaeon]